jgi:fido (protein-threonine AMPylation protein)
MFRALFIASNDTPKRLAAVNQPLNAVAFAVAGPVKKTVAAFVMFARDHGAQTMLTQPAPDATPSVRFIADHPPRSQTRLASPRTLDRIENNTLTLKQVTSILDGKRVLGHPREIQEVRNAFAAYEAMEGWDPTSRDDLLAAHGLLMTGPMDDSGRFRSGGVGIFRGAQLMHTAPPAERIPQLIDDLLGWLKYTDEHALVTSCVFHYELEFIHPFADGNGRIGRLWQTLILRQWQPLLAYLPVETVIRERQDDYYRVLAEADMLANATPFAEFMLTTLLAAIKEAISTDQVYDHVSDQVARLLKVLAVGEMSSSEIMTALGLSHRPTFRKNYLNPALDEDWIERTQPASPRSSTQRYRLTGKGRRRLKKQNNGSYLQ